VGNRLSANEVIGSFRPRQRGRALSSEILDSMLGILGEALWATRKPTESSSIHNVPALHGSSCVLFHFNRKGQDHWWHWIKAISGKADRCEKCGVGFLALMGIKEWIWPNGAFMIRNASITHSRSTELSSLTLIGNPLRVPRILYPDHPSIQPSTLSHSLRHISRYIRP
jgi:hypothetical protein